jgi:hypothetical protein
VQLVDVKPIEQALLETDSRVLIVDPVSAYVGETDSHKDAPVRGLLAPLAAMAERRGVALLAVMHLKKEAKGPAIHRVGGSIAFGAAARIVLAVAQDQERGGRRVLASVKQNLAPEPPALVYALDNGRLTWGAEPVSGLDIDALLNGPGTPSDQAEQTEAEQIIQGLLEDDSAWPMDAQDARRTGEAHGVHERTFRRTAKRMGIRITRVGFGRAGRWVWHRPPIEDTPVRYSPRPPSVSPMSSMSEQAVKEDTNNIEDKKNGFSRAREGDEKDPDEQF